jgi:simple sugar transport system ATP-binding protein
LRYIAQARDRNLGVIFITHNPHHAYAVGDRFTILKRGRTLGTWTKDEITREDMIRSMSGADELEALSHELDEVARRDAAKAAELAETEHEIAESLEQSEELFEPDQED